MYSDKSDEVADRLQQDGTFTLEGGLITHGTGYQVGGIVPAVINPTPAVLRIWLAQVIEDKPQSNIGRWTDNNWDVYYDVSEWIQHRDLALSLARLRGEQSIWDWAASTVIYTNEVPA
jgi:hypothetical protein